MEIDEKTLIYRVYCTVMQMMVDRGYNVSEDKRQPNIEEFKERMGETRDCLNSIFYKPPRTKEDGTKETPEEVEKISIFYLDKDKINKQDVLQVVERVIAINCLNAILIIKGST